MNNPNVWSKNPVFLLHTNLLTLAANHKGKFFGEEVTPENQAQLTRSPAQFFLSVQPTQTVLFHLTLGGRTFTAVKRFGDLHPLSTYYLAFLHNKDISKPLITIDPSLIIPKNNKQYIQQLLKDAREMYHQMLLHLIYLFGFEDAESMPKDAEEALRNHYLFDVEFIRIDGMGQVLQELHITGLGSDDAKINSPDNQKPLTLWDLFEANRQLRLQNGLPKSIQSNSDYGYITLVPIPTYVLECDDVYNKEVARLTIGSPETSSLAIDNSMVLFPVHINETLYKTLDLLYSPLNDPLQLQNLINRMDIDSKEVDILTQYDFMNLVCLLIEPTSTSFLVAQFAIRALPPLWWELAKKVILDKKTKMQLQQEPEEKQENTDEDLFVTPVITEFEFDNGKDLFERGELIRSFFSNLEIFHLHSHDLSKTITTFRIIEIKQIQPDQSLVQSASASAIPQDVVMAD